MSSCEFKFMAPLEGSVPKKRKYVAGIEWDRYKDIILDLRRQRHSASEVKEIMEGLSALKYRLKTWDDKRYLNRKQRRYIIQTMQKHPERVPTFRFLGEREKVDPQKIANVWERRRRERGINSMSIGGSWENQGASTSCHHERTTVPLTDDPLSPCGLVEATPSPSATSIGDIIEPLGPWGHAVAQSSPSYDALMLEWIQSFDISTPAAFGRPKTPVDYPWPLSWSTDALAHSLGPSGIDVAANTSSPSPRDWKEFVDWSLTEEAPKSPRMLSEFRSPSPVLEDGHAGVKGISQRGRGSNGVCAKPETLIERCESEAEAIRRQYIDTSTYCHTETLAIVATEGTDIFAEEFAISILQLLGISIDYVYSGDNGVGIPTDYVCLLDGNGDLKIEPPSWSENSRSSDDADWKKVVNYITAEFVREVQSDSREQDVRCESTPPCGKLSIEYVSSKRKCDVEALEDSSESKIVRNTTNKDFPSTVVARVPQICEQFSHDTVVGDVFTWTQASTAVPDICPETERKLAGIEDISAGSSEYKFEGNSLAWTNYRIEDPEVQKSMVQYDIAAMLYVQCEYESATEHLDQPLTVFRKRLGSDHPIFLKTRLLQGLVKRALYHFDEAEQIFTETARIFEKAFGPKNYTTRWAYYQLAFTYLRSYRLNEIWMPICKACARTPNDISPLSSSLDTLTVKALLVALEVYSLQDQGFQATRLALALAPCLVGVSNDSGVSADWAALQLSRILTCLGRFDEALSVLCRGITGTDNVSSVYQNKDILGLEVKYQVNRTGLLRGTVPEVWKLEALFLEELSGWGEKFPTDGFVAFNVIHALGFLNYKIKNYVEAIKYYRRCLIMLSRLYGKDHFQTLSVINDVVVVMNERGMVLYARPLAYYAVMVADKWFKPTDRMSIEVILQAAELEFKLSGLYDVLKICQAM